MLLCIRCCLLSKKWQFQKKKPVRLPVLRCLPREKYGALEEPKQEASLRKNISVSVMTCVLAAEISGGDLERNLATRFLCSMSI